MTARTAFEWMPAILQPIVKNEITLKFTERGMRMLTQHFYSRLEVEEEFLFEWEREIIVNAFQKVINENPYKFNLETHIARISDSGIADLVRMQQRRCSVAWIVNKDSREHTGKSVSKTGDTTAATGKRVHISPPRYRKSAAKTTA